MKAPPRTRKACTSILERASEKLGMLAGNEPGLWPFYTEGGKWIRSGETWTEWCQGFLPGMMWILHDFTGDKFFRDRAIERCLAIKERAADPAIHDHGFLFRSSWLKWFEHDGDRELLEPVLLAGETLAGRARGEGKYLCSFLGDHSLFIDIMMNVGITIFAGKKLEKEELVDKGTRHSYTTRRYLVRGDGSTLHEGVFDPVTGEFLKPSTQQGARPDSCWARGQAWALYGFADVYKLTGIKEFLETSRFCAGYFIDSLGGDTVPPNDFDDPSLPPDSSAAAIAASGLIEIGKILGDGEGTRYKETAYSILEGLAGGEYLAPPGPVPEGILLKGIYHLKKGLGVGECTAWGDYFLLEACAKVLGLP